MFILLPCFAYANIVDMHKSVIARERIASGGSCDDCSGSLILSNHFESTDIESGTPCGCADGSDTTMAATGSPALSTTWKSDGTYSGHFNADTEYYQLDNTISHDDIKITWDMRVISLPTTGEQGVISVELNNEEYISITYNTTGDASVRAYREGSSVASNVRVYTTLVTGSTLSCEYQIKVGVAGVDSYLKIGSGTDEDDDDPTALTSACDKVIYGHGGVLSTGSGGEIYIDNVKISVSDRY